MMPDAPSSPPPRLMPFHVLVNAANGDEPVTLLHLSCSHGVALPELRAANPELEAFACEDPLPSGILVKLPPMLSMRQPSVGASFCVGSTLTQMLHVRATLDALVQAEPRSAAFVPQRRVASKPAHLVDVLRRESAQQLAALKEEYKSIAADVSLSQEYHKNWKRMLVEERVNAEPVREYMESVETEFRSSGHLSLQPENTHVFSGVPIRLPPNVVNEQREHTVLDTSTCMEGTHMPCSLTHTRELEVSFFRPGSSVALQETWAVLPCQALSALVDALECPHEQLPFPTTKNRFFFINGTFYIDDRHEDFHDLTEVIRQFSPHGSTAPGPYANCPVLSMQTPFSAVSIKLRELCVYRHMGSCDHYFYFADVGPHRRDPRPRLEYPRRIYLAPTRVTVCEMCGMLPATIATYGDRFTPKTPALFCPPCFRVFHVNELGEEVQDGYLKFELPPGKHF